MRKNAKSRSHHRIYYQGLIQTSLFSKYLMIMDDKDAESSIYKLSQSISCLRGIGSAESFLLSTMEGLASMTAQYQDNVRLSQEKFEQNIVDLIKIHKFLKISLKKSEETTETGLALMNAKIDHLFQSIDANLLALIEEYTAILHDELENNKRRLFSEKSDSAAIRREANIFRQIKLFAEKLSFSSQEKATMTFLHPTSIQYEKCEKAFIENIHPDLQRRGYSNIQVFQIIHLQNQYLSSLLQVHQLITSLSR
jgi:hypothetical protein